MPPLAQYIRFHLNPLPARRFCGSLSGTDRSWEFVGRCPPPLGWDRTQPSDAQHENRFWKRALLTPTAQALNVQLLRLPLPLLNPI